VEKMLSVESSLSMNGRAARHDLRMELHRQRATDDQGRTSCAYRPADVDRWLEEKARNSARVTP